MIVTDLKILRQVSQPLKTMYGVKTTVEKLKKALKTGWTEGVGLTAIQIGIPKRIAWLKFDDGEEITLINPKIIDRSKEKLLEKEGCLSIFNVWTPVVRSKIILVDINSFAGEDELTRECTVYKDFKARAIQHIIDLMDGILPIDKEAKLIKKKQTNTTPEEDRANRNKAKRDKAKRAKKARQKNRKK